VGKGPIDSVEFNDLGDDRPVPLTFEEGETEDERPVDLEMAAIVDQARKDLAREDTDPHGSWAPLRPGGGGSVVGRIPDWATVVTAALMLASACGLAFFDGWRQGAVATEAAVTCTTSGSMAEC
jgi:hypothetical protein